MKAGLAIPRVALLLQVPVYFFRRLEDAIAAQTLDDLNRRAPRCRGRFGQHEENVHRRPLGQPRRADLNPAARQDGGRNM
jgi:hypothetical protein